MRAQTREEKIEELLLLEEKAKRARFNKIRTFYPETGPLRRELYPKHREIFRLGSVYRERCFQGGNGCITPWTHIETAQSMRPISEMLSSASVDVVSWDGERRCIAKAGGVFLKEFAPAFRFHLDNGQWFDSNGMHRVLLASGSYRTVSQLIHASSGSRYSRKHLSSTANCDMECRLYDELLHRWSDIGLEPIPSRADAPALCHSGRERMGEVEHKPRCIHASLSCVRFSKRIYDPIQIAALCAPFEDPTVQLVSLWPPSLRQELLRTQSESSLIAETALIDPCQRPSSRDGAGASLSCPSSASTPGQISELLGIGRLSVRMCGPDQPERQFLDGLLGEWLYVVSSHEALHGGNRILSVEPLGIQPILDLTVEGTSCYSSAGLIHHNTGKTEGVGAYEVTLHATGNYPDDWEGKRHDSPVDIWVAGDTKETVRDITQTKLLGDVAKIGLSALGTGMIPRDAIVDSGGKFNGKFRQGTNYACDFVSVKHKSGGYSTIGFKSYDQRRESFQGTEKHLIWLDEEPPMDIYLECLMRGRKVKGQILLTFTPLSGPTEVVKSFGRSAQANDEGASKVLVKCTWDDVPHLTEEEKRQMLASCPPYLRAARMNGEAVAGVGRVYPLDEKDFVIKPFQGGIPDYWPRLFAVDCGWRCTAAVWLAHDRDNDVAYVYSEYFRGEVDVPVHAAAIKARGLWIPGVGDVAGASQTNGDTFIDLYRKQGLRIKVANKAVDAGIANVFERLSSGRLKILSTCERLLDEIRTYSYDEKGKIKKEDDHGMDALRYGIMDIDSARVKRQVETMPQLQEQTFGIYR